MCLSTIEYDYNKNLGFGYKVLVCDNDKLVGMFYYGLSKPGVWETSDPRPADGYTSGFHIFLSLESAKQIAKCSSTYEVWKVEYRDIMYIGHDGTDPLWNMTVVAKEARLVEQIPFEIVEGI